MQLNDQELNDLIEAVFNSISIKLSEINAIDGEERNLLQKENDRLNDLVVKLTDEQHRRK